MFIDHFSQYQFFMKVDCENAHPYLKLKTRSRFHPVSLFVRDGRSIVVEETASRRNDMAPIFCREYVRDERTVSNFCFSPKKEFGNVIQAQLSVRQPFYQLYLTNIILRALVAHLTKVALGSSTLHSSLPIEIIVYFSEI